MSDRNSDGSISTYGGSNPPAAPTKQDLDALFKKWLIAEHNNTLIEDRAWLHLPDDKHLVSRLVFEVDWHKAPKIWGLFIVPIKGSTTIQYETQKIVIDKPITLQTNVLHKWIPNTRDNIFWAYKII